MDAEIGVAMEDWEGVPTHELSEVCAEARRRAKGFPPPNSLVVDVWGEERHRRDKARRDAELYLQDREPVVERTPEEKAELQKFFDGLRKTL